MRRQAAGGGADGGQPAGKKRAASVLWFNHLFFLSKSGAMV